MTEDELRGVAIPQGAQRHRSDAITLLDDARVPPRTRRIVDTTPSGVNAMKRRAEGSVSGAGVSGGFMDTSVDTVVGVGEDGGDTDATTLGTLVHRLLELRIAAAGARDTPEITEELWRPDHHEARSVLWRVEEPEEQLEMCRTSWDLSERFLSSPFWEELQAREGNRSIACEVPFYLRAGDPALYLNGKIDLVVEYSDHVEVVDFKSDREVVPEHYEMQMAVYRRAAEELYGKPGSVHLFYLRTGEAIYVDAELEELLREIDLSEVDDDGVSFSP
jgi:hypothetical protein